MTESTGRARAAPRRRGRRPPKRLLARLDALLTEVWLETPDARVVQIGPFQDQVSGLLRRRWEAVTVAASGELDRLPDGGFDLVVAVDVLDRRDAPEAAVGDLARLTTRQLVLAVRRDPLRAAGRWGVPRLMRLASTVGAVRDIRLPLPWAVLWVRRG